MQGTRLPGPALDIDTTLPTFTDLHLPSVSSSPFSAPHILLLSPIHQLQSV
jgi:hypothetical protein